jgi:hypothetical protein
LLNVAWAICEESSRGFPAHHSDLPDVQRPVIGLFSALSATQLAGLMCCWATTSPAAGQTYPVWVDQRIITPFLTRHDFWWLHPRLAVT